MHFLKRKFYFYFRKQNPSLLKPKETIKKSLYFGKWNLLALLLKSFLYFFWNATQHVSAQALKIKKPPRENFLYFRKRKPWKTFSYFLKKKHSYVLGNRNLKKFLIFQEKKFFYTLPKEYSESSVIFIIFWNVLMIYQIFLSPQVKQWAIISYKHGIYELLHELPKDLRILGN